MKKNLIPILLIISILFNIGLVYKFFYEGENAVLKEDGRIEIKMTRENREFVMAEMRGFLESIQQINQGIMTSNPADISKVGAQSGTCKVKAAPQGLVRSLPFDFKQMGFATHQLFEETAKLAKEKYDRQQAQVKLNQLLNNCTACHKTYKITAE